MTDEKEALRQRVAKQIEEAFADTPYPGDNNIGWGCGWEGAEFEEALRRQHWKDLTLDFIIKHRDKVPCMTPAGFRFYLPAFMLATVFHWEEVDTLSSGVIRNLTPPPKTDAQRIFQMFPKLADVSSVDDYADQMMDHFLQRVKAFTQVEQDSVKLFLQSYPDLFPFDVYEHERAQYAFEFWDDLRRLK